MSYNQGYYGANQPPGPPQQPAGYGAPYGMPPGSGGYAPPPPGGAVQPPPPPLSNPMMPNGNAPMPVPPKSVQFFSVASGVPMPTAPSSGGPPSGLFLTYAYIYSELFLGLLTVHFTYLHSIIPF